MCYTREQFKLLQFCTMNTLWSPGRITVFKKNPIQQEHFCAFRTATLLTVP